MKPHTTIITLAAISLLTACAEKKKSVADLREKDEKNHAEKAKQLPEIEATLTLNYVDETVTVTSFDKAQSNMIFASKGKISVNLVGQSTEGDRPKRLVISFPHADILSPPFTGTHAAGSEARFASNRFIGNAQSAISLSEGTINVTECDKDGNFALEFEGKGGTIASTPQPFSGTLKVKNLKVVQY